MYPEADIPVVQLSIDGTRPAVWHFQMGQQLAALRDRGVMLVASGNVVHNLRMARWEKVLNRCRGQAHLNATYVITEWQGEAGAHPLVNFMGHDGAALANPTPEHYLPLLYILGSRQANEPVTVPVEGIEMSTLSMLSVQVG